MKRLNFAAIFLVISLFKNIAAEADDLRPCFDLIREIVASGPKKSTMRAKKINPSERPKIISEYLKGDASDWYRIALEFNPLQIDPIFLLIAQNQQQSILLGPGSDLVQSILGVSKTLYGSEVTEVNLVMRKGIEFVDALKTTGQMEIPAFRDRPLTNLSEIYLNNESSLDIELYVNNFNSGKNIVEGKEEFINVPLKSMGILKISPDGSATIYFRTQQDYQDYLNKILRLPYIEGGGDKYASFLRTKNNTLVIQAFAYPLILLARGLNQGWQLDLASKQFLIEGLHALTVPEKEKLKEVLMLKAGDEESTLEAVENILTLFQI